MRCFWYAPLPSGLGSCSRRALHSLASGFSQSAEAPLTGWHHVQLPGMVHRAGCLPPGPGSSTALYRLSLTAGHWQFISSLSWRSHPELTRMCSLLKIKQFNTVLLEPMLRQRDILENMSFHAFLTSYAPNNHLDFSLPSAWHTSPASTQIFGAGCTHARMWIDFFLLSSCPPPAIFT